LKSLKDLDVNHANKLSETAASVRELIKTNISKNKETVKKVAEKLQVQFDKAAKVFYEGVKKTEKAYIKLIQKFSQTEESFRNGESSEQDQDLWYVQYQFLKKA